MTAAVAIAVFISIDVVELAAKSSAPRFSAAGNEAPARRSAVIFPKSLAMASSACTFIFFFRALLKLYATVAATMMAATITVSRPRTIKRKTARNTVARIIQAGAAVANFLLLTTLSEFFVSDTDVLKARRSSA